MRSWLLAALFLVVSVPGRGQLTTGVLRGRVVDDHGQTQPGVTVLIAGGPGYRVQARSDTRGIFEAVLPYGKYSLTAQDTPRGDVYVPPLQTTQVEVVLRGDVHSETARPVEPNEAISFSPHGVLLAAAPAIVTDPLDFSGLASMRLPLISDRSFSWTNTRYTLQGMNVTDAYQPGRTVVFPDIQAIGEVILRGGLDLGTSPAYGSEIGIFTHEPTDAWHGGLSSSDTGSSFASGNLPEAATRGDVQQPERFHWFTRDNLQTGGPLGRRADLFLSGTGQWSSQSVPQAAAPADLNSRLLFGNARARVALSSKDQLDAQFSGSRIDLNNWGVPAGLEALAGWRMSTELVPPQGFAWLGETDHLDSLHLGWTRQLLGPERTGALEVRYGFSTAHLDTYPSPQTTTPSLVDITSGVANGVPPLANKAVRVRHDLQAAFAPGGFEFAGWHHEIALGGGWEQANVRNRFTTPDDLILITANGTPAFAVELNTTLDSQERIGTASAYVRDSVRMARWLTVDLSAVADFARGWLPAQSSPAGTFAPQRRYAADADIIAWNSVSPRAALAIAPPFAGWLVLRGSYARIYSPLAGRYLDFANPNSLGGTAYQWLGQDQVGPPLMRFGGPFSTVDSHLRRPYADEFNLAAQARLPLGIFGTLRFFRRDDKDRIAAINTGVPAGNFHPVEILDPGPDAVPGTFDDQTLTVYAQDPSTLGKDQYLLTNPPDLRMLHEGVLAELGSRWRTVQAHASFMAVKSHGPTNPGDSVIENDPGVVGALFADPNTLIHAAGRDYFDRAYLGKVQLTARLPRALGGIECANTAVYMDGLVFGRRLLVTGLPQGPFLVAATVRGSPEGGNRAEYILNWNLQLSRAFALPYGSLRLALDILNATNANNRTQESDLTGPLFNQRLPLAIQPPRFLRWNLQYQF